MFEKNAKFKTSTTTSVFPLYLIIKFPAIVFILIVVLNEVLPFQKRNRDERG